MSDVSAVQVPLKISNAVKKASQATGTDFDYLLKTAQRESSFRPDARAKTSSATGLFQFVENTWLQMVKEQGPALGLDNYSAFILKGRGGRYTVSDPGLRKEILALRKDPETASLMAAALTQQNEAHVTSRVGRAPTSGELYAAHVLGAEGASRLIELAEARPNAAADRHFPRAADANRSIFYSAGKARSVSDVYDILTRKHGNTAPVQVAAAAPETRGLPSRKPATAETPEVVVASHFARISSDKPGKSQAQGSIGAWTTNIYRPDEGAAFAPSPRAEPKVAGSLMRGPTDPITPKQEQAPLPIRKEAGAQPKTLNLPSAAFNLFAEDVLADFELGGA